MRIRDLWRRSRHHDPDRVPPSEPDETLDETSLGFYERALRRQAGRYARPVGHSLQQALDPIDSIDSIDPAVAERYRTSGDLASGGFNHYGWGFGLNDSSGENLARSHAATIRRIAAYGIGAHRDVPMPSPQERAEAIADMERRYGIPPESEMDRDLPVRHATASWPTWYTRHPSR
jgi:hypothetical protein